MLSDVPAGAPRSPTAGQSLPLAGPVVAVQDNIDVAGLPTTAACPEFAYVPATTAAAVERPRGAGAVVLGKTNLVHFGTGFVGTRSPSGAVRNSHHPTGSFRPAPASTPSPCSWRTSAWPPPRRR
jgi:Asp-tRNA(Asn)/Glu-tRNA(Gln) amidotransferase A subunit family amidase